MFWSIFLNSLGLILAILIVGTVIAFVARLMSSHTG